MAPDGDVIKKPYEHEPLGVLTPLTFWPKEISIQEGAVIGENKRRICVFEMYIIKVFTTMKFFVQCFK